MSIENLKGRWKYLRDCYIKAKRKVDSYKRSGAEASTEQIGFRFYNTMQFLSDTLQRKNISCTITTLPEPSPSSSREPDETDDPGTPISTATKKRKAGESKELQRAIVAALTNEPETPVSSGLDGFLLRVGESLKRFSYKKRSMIEIKILQMLHDEDENSE